jgi:hypothetical protein
MIEVNDASVLWPMLVVLAIVVARRYRNLRRVERGVETTPPPKGHLQINRSIPDKVSELDGHIDAFPHISNVAMPRDFEKKEQMIKDKDLYWMLQNVEDHPGEYTRLHTTR